MNKLWTFGDSFTWGHGCKEDKSTDKNSFYNIKYCDYINPSKQIWPEHVSEKIKYELHNYGVNGTTNDSILDNVLKQFNNFKKNDIIIIQISTSGRYDFPFVKSQKMMGGWNEEPRDYIYDTNNLSPYFLKTIFVDNILKEYEDGGEDTLLYTNTGQYLRNENLKLSKRKYELIREFFSEFIVTKKYYEREVWRFIKISEILSNLEIKVFILHEDYWPQPQEKMSNLITIGENGLLEYIIDKKYTIMHDTKGAIIDFHPSYDGHVAIGENILKHINENTDLYNT